MPAHELNDAGIPVAALDILAGSEIVLEGRMPWASNATFLVHLDGVDAPATAEAPKAIYKPLRGERPLWDFEPGLHRREVATYRLSEAMGLGVVPPTVLRTEGPLGEGSLQWYVDADHRQHYFTVYEQRDDLHDQLQAIAVLDVVANNTDRKSGHCLLAGDRVWAIDNGLCFAVEYKLRTVIWEFADEPLTAAQHAACAAVAAAVPDDIARLLAPDEVEAVQRRAMWLAETGVLPGDDTGHRYPWPLV